MCSPGKVWELCVLSWKTGILSWNALCSKIAFFNLNSIVWWQYSTSAELAYWWGAARTIWECSAQVGWFWFKSCTGGQQLTPSTSLLLYPSDSPLTVTKLGFCALETTGKQVPCSLPWIHCCNWYQILLYHSNLKNFKDA